jgi:Flp pilus assembly protein TadB
MTTDGSASLLANLGVSGSALVAVTGAIQGDTLLSWGAAFVALACLGYARYRDQISADKRQRRLDEFEDAVNKARIAAIAGGKPDPYPHGLPFEADVNRGKS